MFCVNCAHTLPETVQSVQSFVTTTHAMPPSTSISPMTLTTSIDTPVPTTDTVVTRIKKRVVMKSSSRQEMVISEQEWRESASKELLTLPQKLFLVVMLAFVSVACILFTRELMQEHFAKRFDVLDIIGGILVLIGSVYLTYDLLGRENGMLRWLTHFILSGFMGALLGSPFVAYVRWISNDMPRSHQFILIFFMVGAFAGSSLNIASIDSKPRLFSLKAFGLGTCVGILFAMLFMLTFEFGQPDISNQLRTPTLYIMCVAIALTVGLGSSLWPFAFYNAMYPESRTYKESIRQLLKLTYWTSVIIAASFFYVLMAALLLYGLYYVIFVSQDDLIVRALAVLFALVIDAIPVWFISFIPALFIAPVVVFSDKLFKLSNRLPENYLGAFGLIVILIGTFLGFAEHIFHILGMP